MQKWDEKAIALWDETFAELYKEKGKQSSFQQMHMRYHTCRKLYQKLHEERVALTKQKESAEQEARMKAEIRKSVQDEIESKMIEIANKNEEI